MPRTLSEISPLINSVTKQDYVVYKARWFQVFLFSCCSFSNAILWITFSSITDEIKSFFGVSSFWVDALSLVFMILYVPFVFFASWCLDVKSLRFGLTVGLVFTVLGGWVRVAGVNHSVFFLVMIGQSLAAIGQPFILNAQPVVAANWFPDGERTVATTICSLSNPIGVAFGFVFPTWIVKDSDDTWRLLLYEAIIVTVLCVFGGIFIRSKPLTPPSASAQQESLPLSTSSFFGEFAKLFGDWNFVCLFLVFGLTLGAFNTLATLLNQILSPFNYSNSQTGLLGALVIIAGLVGSGLAGALVDKTHKYKLMLLLCLLGGAISTILIAFFLKENNIVPLAISVAVLGFTMTPVLPLALELSLEITFPMSESLPSGLLMTNGQIVGIILILIMYKLLNEKLYSAAVWIVVGCFGCGFLLMIAFRGELKRLNYEKVPGTIIPPA